MFRLRVARYTGDALAQAVLAEGQLAINSTTHKLFVGDGIQLGGWELGIKIEEIEQVLSSRLGVLQLTDLESLQTALSEALDYSSFTDKAVELNALLAGYFDQSMMADLRREFQDRPTQAQVEELSGVTEGLETKSSFDTAKQIKADKSILFDSSGLIRGALLPDDIDEVHEFADLSKFPLQGVKGRIYVDLLLAKIYRWSGTQYIELANPKQLEFSTEEETVGLVNDRSMVTPSGVSGVLGLLGISAFEDGGFQLDSGDGDPEGYVAYSGPGPSTLLYGTKKDGFFGFVPHSEMISAFDLFDQLGFSEGTLGYPTTDWIKFIQDAVVKFIPVKPLRKTTSWNTLYNAGLVYGTEDNGLYPTATPTKQNAKVVYKHGDETTFFKVRLPTMANNDPVLDTSLVKNGEWYRLFQHFVVPALPDVERWGDLTTAMMDLNGGNNGIGYALGQTTTGASGNTLAVQNELLNFTGISKAEENLRRHWRPLLEVVPPGQVNFVLPVRDVKNEGLIEPSFSRVRVSAPDSANALMKIDTVQQESDAAIIPATKPTVSYDELTPRDTWQREQDDMAYTSVLSLTTD